MKIVRLLIAGIMLAAAPCALAAEPGAAASEALFASLQKSAGGVNTLASDFVQEKHLSMFKSAMSSKGRFYFMKPDRLRWELTAPVASGFVLKGEKGRRWHQRTGRTESFNINQ